MPRNHKRWALLPGELEGYDVAKGTVGFPPNRPPPTTLVRQLVQRRMAENQAARAKRQRGQSTA
jgi:uncharacterized protein YdhG (YjbR/CyaY superfamily)